ncbi:MAG: leucine-rich repeat protein [Oscillospiraceae bacterium]|nr:leucine-rich repeat protein [Oscillospiraceae bacterium]
MKRILSLLLCLVMLLSLIPAAAAEDIVIIGTEEPGPAGTIEIVDPEPVETVPEPGAELTATAGKPVITASPQSVTAYVGTTAKFTVTATGAESYQWYYRTSAEGSWKESTAASAATATLSVVAASYRSGYQYYCKVRNANGTSYTKAATLTVTEKPLIKTQPASVTAQAGTEAKFTVKATGAESYQWYYRTSASGSWSKSTAASAATATLTVAAEKKRDGYQYRCKVSNAGGYVYTEAATLTVEAIPKPEITKQPKDFTASTGTDAYFRVTATGAESYQWYYRTSASGSWSKCSASGATGPALTVKAEDRRSGYQYRCKVSNAGGYVYSEAATLTTAGQITYRALLIGEVHFSWETAKRNRDDVTHLRRVLQEVDAGYGGRYTVTCAYDLSNNGIRDAISSAFAGADDNDVSLFFLATHGVVDVASGSQAGAMVTITSPGAWDDYLTMGDLAAWLKQVPGKVIVLLGSCGSGAAIVSNGGEVSFVPSDSDEYDALFTEAVIAAFEEQNEMIPVSEDGVISNTGEFRSSKFYVLTAAAHQESSWGFEGESGSTCYNYFTEALCHGVRDEHPADSNKNGTMTLKEIYKYVYDHALGPYYDGSGAHYQHVQVYPANSSYALFRYDVNGPVITEQPRKYTASPGVTKTLRVVAEGAESYQWQWRSTKTDGWENCELSGSQTAELKVKSSYANSNYDFRCLVSGPGGTTASDVGWVRRGEKFDDTHKWWIDNKGNLSITGTGPLPDDLSLWTGSPVPRYVTIGKGTTYIGSNFFKGCYNMETVKLPDTVTGIGDRAFYGCKLLHTLNVPKNLTSVGSYAFGDTDPFNACRNLYLSLDTVTLSEIGEYAFAGCHLQSVKLAGDMTAIPDRAFAACRDLRSIDIPDSVTMIGSGAFSSCNSLTSFTVPDGVTEIGSGAFSYCNSLTSFTVPDSVTTIGSGAFSNCDSLTSFTVPDSVTSLGDECFAYCDSLKTVNIGKSVKTINVNMFTNCYALETIKVASGNAKYASSNGVLLNRSKTTLILCPKGITGALTLPSTVTTIKDTALKDCRKLESITIPDGVTSLPDACFKDCWALTEVQFGSGVKEITVSLFEACPALESITVASGNANYASSGGALLNKAKTMLLFCPKGKAGSYTIPSTVKTISDRAFYQCDKLTSVTIPNGVTAIGLSAFSWCTGLTGVTIPDSVTTVGEDAFNNCSAITSAKLGKGLTEITKGMFCNCSALTSVTIPSTVKTIGDYAFYSCDLRELRLSKNVTAIGECAFTNNLNLSDVYYTGTKTQWNKITIGEYNENLTNATIHYNA